MPPAMTYALPALQLVCNLVAVDEPAWSETADPSGSAINYNSTPVIAFANLPRGYVAHPDIGAAYKIYNESVTWKQAREKCLKEGARLAVTDTYVKFEHLMDQLPSANWIHVGIHRMYDDAEWVSATTGATITPVPWAPGNPNGVLDCVMAGYSPRGLKNAACTTKSFVACELPIQKNLNKQGNQMATITVK